MSPQIRVFMEVAWEAFENAGYVGEKMRGPVGVWAGMGNNFYYVHNVLTRPDKLAVMGRSTS
jgi:acyl transferase domain-containing protein